MSADGRHPGDGQPPAWRGYGRNSPVAGEPADATKALSEARLRRGRRSRSGRSTAYRCRGPGGCGGRSATAPGGSRWSQAGQAVGGGRAGWGCRTGQQGRWRRAGPDPPGTEGPASEAGDSPGKTGSARRRSGRESPVPGERQRSRRAAGSASQSRSPGRGGRNSTSRRSAAGRRGTLAPGGSARRGSTWRPAPLSRRGGEGRGVRRGAGRRGLEARCTAGGRIPDPRGRGQ